FSLTVIAWIFFRAENISHALSIISEIFSNSIFISFEVLPIKIIFLISFMLIIEWFGRKNKHALSNALQLKKRYMRWSLYIFICILIFVFKGHLQEFIYFQF
ncbi:MAG: MBOAT family O-acyltransferase, partial [Psychroflexus sp.]